MKSFLVVVFCVAAGFNGVLCADRTLKRSRDRDEIASRVPDALIPRKNRSLRKTAATRNAPVIVPYDQTGTKFDPPPLNDAFSARSASPPYKTYNGDDNNNDEDSEEYQPVRVARGYEDRYDPNYNPVGRGNERDGGRPSENDAEDSRDESSGESSDRAGPRAERYRGPPPPPAGVFPSHHDARSSRHQDFSGEQREDFHPEDKHHYDLPPPARVPPIPSPSPQEDAPGSMPQPMSHRERGRDHNSGGRLKPLGIVYALPQDDGSYKLQQSGHQRAIQIKVDDPSEVINLSQLGLSLNDANGEEPSENILVQHVGAIGESSLPSFAAVRGPFGQQGILLNSRNAKQGGDAARGGGLRSSMSRWNPLGGWGIGSLFNRRSKSNDVHEAVLVHRPGRTVNAVSVPLEAIPHIHRFRPAPGHEIIVTHPPLAERSDSVDLKAGKIRRRRSADQLGSKQQKPTTPELGPQPSASGLLPRYSEDESGYYAPYTLRTFANLANIFRATDDEKEESTDRFTTQRAQPRFGQVREARSDNERDFTDLKHSQLGSGNFEVIRGGIFNNEEISTNHLGHGNDNSNNNNNQQQNGNNNNNNYYTNNPYRATVVQDNHRDVQHQNPASFDVFDDDSDDQVFGFQGFEDFAAPLNNALSRHRHLLGAAASETHEKKTKPHSEPCTGVQESSKKDHMSSATEHFTVVDSKMLAEE